MQQLFRLLTAGFAFLLLSLLGSRPVLADQAVRVDDIVAIVGDEAILRSEVVANARTKDERVQREVLDRIIETALIVTDAYRLGLHVSNLEVAQEKARILRETNRQRVAARDYDARIETELLELKWMALVVKLRVKTPVPVGATPEGRAPFLRELEAERKRAIAELRKANYVEVRW